jgi:hypothetical protein
MTDTTKTRPLFTRREPTEAEARQDAAAVWECPVSAFESDAWESVPIPETLNGVPLSAANRKILAGLTPRERSIVLSVVRNHPPISVREALEDCRAFGM